VGKVEEYNGVIDVSSLAAGMYYIRLNVDNKMVTKKLIIGNCIGRADFCHKMPFIAPVFAIFLSRSLATLQKNSFNIHKNAYFLSKNRST